MATDDVNTLTTDELLAEAVRSYPVLYDKTIKDFKNKNLKENAWKAVADAVPGIATAADAKRMFLNLRSRYTRDKQKLKSKKVSGGSAKDVEEVKKDASEMYPFLSWLDSFIINRRRTKGNVACATEESEAGNSSECDETSEVDLDTSSTSTENLSKVTGKLKWDKKKKPDKRTAEEVEVEMIRCMLQFAKRPAETSKDADELFGSFVASQLRNMTAEQNAIAKFQINQLCFQIKMSGMGLPPTAYNSSQVPAGQTFHPMRVSSPYTAPEQILLPFDGGNVTNPPSF